MLEDRKREITKVQSRAGRKHASMFSVCLRCGVASHVCLSVPGECPCPVGRRRANERMCERTLARSSLMEVI